MVCTDRKISLAGHCIQKIRRGRQSIRHRLPHWVLPSACGGISTVEACLCIPGLSEYSVFAITVKTMDAISNSLLHKEKIVHKK